MPRKSPLKTKTLTLQDYLSNYEYKSLQAAVVSLQDSFAWDILRSFIRVKQREFEVAALDLACHDGHSLEAAKASGLACGMEELAEKTIPEFIDLVMGKTGIVEDPRPEDVNS